MNYSAYDELMIHFQFEFNVYIILSIIILIGAFRAVINYVHLRKSNDAYEMIISLVAFIGLSSGMYFQGVMSDIPLESGYPWVSKSFYLFIVSILLLNVQVIFKVLRDRKLSK